MLSSLALLIALQTQGGGSQADIDRAAEMRRIEELMDESKFQIAAKRNAEYKSKALYNAHYEFVQRFNQYLAKYLIGANPLKEKKAAIKAFEELKKADGF